MFNKFLKYFLIFGGCVALNMAALSQSLTVSENVPVAFNVLPPAIPGDPPALTYENVMGDIELSMDGGSKWQFGNTWYVTVSKSTWPTELDLYLRRDPTRTDVVNGSSYLTIPDGPSSIYFFESNNTRRVRNLAVQHKVEIPGVTPGAGNYSTTVTYTILDM